MLRPHRDGHLRVERAIDNLELRRYVYDGTHDLFTFGVPPSGGAQRLKAGLRTTPGCTVRNLVMENLFATHDPASRPAAECGADPDDHRKPRRTDRKSLARANSRYARHP